MNVFKIIIFLLLSTSLSYANNTSTFDMSDRNDYEFFMDDWHKKFSDIVSNVSNYVDESLADSIYDINDTQADINDTEDIFNNFRVTSNDEFFLSEKFLDEKRKGFVKITAKKKVNSRSKFADNTDIKFSARIPLHRFRKRFKVWWENLTEDKDKQISTNSSDSKDKQAIGVSYFSPKRYGIKQRYSLGLSSFYPLARARYSKEWVRENWDIELTQRFTYYTDDGFAERTNLYIDTKFLNLSLFRIKLQREMTEKYSGMNYSLALIGVWRPNQKTGITLAQGFGGNTNYKYTKDEDADPIVYEDRISGINKYTTSLRYRKNFYRKWLFYELGPAVDFDARNSFKTNYSFSVKLDIFFGRGYR